VRWILDDMAFGDIARVVPLSDLSAWPDGELLLADATARAAARDPSGGRQAVLAARSSATGAPIITSFTVTVSSPAGRILYTHLRTGSGGTADLAEHESIAWALTDRAGDSVLVHDFLNSVADSSLPWSSQSAITGHRGGLVGPASVPVILAVASSQRVTGRDAGPTKSCLGTVGQ